MTKVRLNTVISKLATPKECFGLAHYPFGDITDILKT
jgi:hypothetical protein